MRKRVEFSMKRVQGKLSLPGDLTSFPGYMRACEGDPHFLEASILCSCRLGTLARGRLIVAGPGSHKFLQAIAENLDSAFHAPCTQPRCLGLFVGIIATENSHLPDLLKFSPGQPCDGSITRLNLEQTGLLLRNLN